VGPEGYRPDFDLNQAWELGDDGWLWCFEEFIDDTLLVQVCPREGRYWGVSVAVSLGDFSSKANAYATARCRAWLLAQQERGG
jgi:hypothetical protein